MTRIAFLLAAALLALPACGAGESAEPGAETGAPPPAPLPDAARVVCAADGTAVETPRVRPQPDGVHLEVVNESGGERLLELSAAGGEAAGAPAPEGTHVQVVDVAPGSVTVACKDPATGRGGGAPLEIVDEDRIWVPATVACPEVFTQVNDYIQGAEGETSDPIEAARSALAGYGLRPDDVLERAGYPEAEALKVRLVREGETLAVADLFDDGAGKWLVGMVTGCSTLEEG
ncbi:MAG TPA: hypothetical protein VD704_03725 [Gaiellaceae bacterium]|nr:hypothetical protein [Gaiellaceae bacterium]